jgi:uncharacterized protein
MSKKVIGSAITGALLLFSGHSLAASFDCKKANTLVEKAVCSNPKLSKLDDALAKAYQRTLASTSNADTVKTEQKTWLTTVRDICKTEACIEKAYQTRLAELQGATNQLASTWSGEYQRYFNNKVDTHTSTLTIRLLANQKVKVTGTSLWVGDAERGNVNLGAIEGEFPVVKGRIQYQDDSACKLTIIFKQAGLEVKNDNGQCGGLNVSFDGYYRKIK